MSSSIEESSSPSYLRFSLCQREHRTEERREFVGRRAEIAQNHRKRAVEEPWKVKAGTAGPPIPVSL